MSDLIATLATLIGAIVAGAVGLVVARQAGRRAAEREQETRNAEAYRETRRRMDGSHSGGSDAEWLRERGE